MLGTARELSVPPVSEIFEKCQEETVRLMFLFARFPSDMVLKDVYIFKSFWKTWREVERLLELLTNLKRRQREYSRLLLAHPIPPAAPVSLFAIYAHKHFLKA